MKDFKPMTVGTMTLKQGRGELRVRATRIAHQDVMDLRAVTLRLLK